LGFRYYGHFTSPIRRYPDVLAHRILDDVLHHRKPHSLAHLEEMCKHSSEREKIAADAERASIKFKMAEYLGERIGQVFPGMVTGITEWGLYVELEGSKIEGMVWLNEMPGDTFSFNERERCIQGRYSGTRLYMGDNVRIRVRKTNPLKRQIDFEFLEKTGGAQIPALAPVAPGVLAPPKARAKATQMPAAHPAPPPEGTPFYTAVFKPGKNKPTHRGAGGPGTRGKPGPKRRDNSSIPKKKKK
jgi:ribonuclease R